MKNLILSFILSSYIFALDICKSDKVLCENIIYHQDIIKSSNNKLLLKSMIFLSKKLIFLNENDRNEIINDLTSIPQYTSIFSKNNIFLTLAEKCKKKIYIAEAYFDKDYHILFLEKKVSAIKNYDTYYMIDHKKYELLENNYLMYKNAFKNVETSISPKHNSIQTIDETKIQLCVHVTKSVVLRDPNTRRKIAWLKDGDKVELIKENSYSYKNTHNKTIYSHLIEYRYKGKKLVGHIQANFLQICED